MKFEAQVTINTKGIRKVLDELAASFGGGGIGAAAASGAAAGGFERMFRQWAERYESFIRRRFENASRGDGTWAPLQLSTILGRQHKGRGLKRALAGRVKGLDKLQQKTYRTTFSRKKKEYLAKFGGGKPAKGAKLTAKQKRAVSLARAQATAAVRRAGGHIATRRVAALPAAGEALILRDTGTLFKALSLDMPGSINRRIQDGIEVGIGGPAAHPGGGASIADIARIHHEGNPAKGLPPRLIIVPPAEDILRGMASDARTVMKRLTDAANLTTGAAAAGGAGAGGAGG